jgi:CRISPR/Cas system CMR-associated protein Cmr5 small subunit
MPNSEILMQNLEQIRARNALRFNAEDGPKIIGPDGGDVISKIPSLILNNGLLGTAAYAFTQKPGWQILFDHVARHLADPDIAIVPVSVKDHRCLMDYLTSSDATSETLKLATAETMAWLTYARRFVAKKRICPNSP